MQGAHNLCYNVGMKQKEIDEVRSLLLKAEGDVEGIGRKLCSAAGGGLAWSAVNGAVEKIQDAIHSLHTIELEQDEES